MHCIYNIIKPSFKYIIPKSDRHMMGPHGIAKIVKEIKLKAPEYKFCIRTDVKDYYNSIDKDILFDIVKKEFGDPRLINYFKQIIFAYVYKNALYYKRHGIRRSTSLSGFFAAIYLKSLDLKFEQACRASNGGIFYIRYNDDILIFTKTFAQYKRARGRLLKTFKALKLKISPHKTQMGRFSSFHFVGIMFCVRYTQDAKTQCDMSLTPRTFKRSDCKATALFLCTLASYPTLLYLVKAALVALHKAIKKHLILQQWLDVRRGEYPSDVLRPLHATHILWRAADL